MRYLTVLMCYSVDMLLFTKVLEAVVYVLDVLKACAVCRSWKLEKLCLEAVP